MREPVTPSRSTFSGRKRWGNRFSLAVGLCLSLYILAVANGIVFRHPIRFDLTSERLLSLSKDTLARLKLIREEVQVVIPTLLFKDNPSHLSQHEVLARARILLNEYMAEQPLIKMAAEVDVVASPDRWEQVRAEFNLEASQVNRILFFAGKSKERRQTVTPGDLAFFGDVRDPAFDVPEIKAFRGEKALTDALGRLISQNRKAIYFTQDKGELQLRPQSEKGGAIAGARALLHELDSEGFDGRPLSLSTAREIPGDCALLVIAGPGQLYSTEELRRLDNYLQNGGKLLAALGARRTGLEDLLEDWGVKVRDGKVQSQRETDVAKIASAEVVAREFSRSHPVTSIFVNVPRFEVQLLLPRPLAQSSRGKDLEVTPILGADSREGMGYYLIGDPNAKGLPRAEDFDLALSVEPRPASDPGKAVSGSAARIVVASSSTLLSDQYWFRSSNRDFIMNTVAWLTGEVEKTTEGSVAWAQRTLRMDAAIERYLFWVPILLLPGVFLAAGALVYYVRRT